MVVPAGNPADSIGGQPQPIVVPIAALATIAAQEQVKQLLMDQALVVQAASVTASLNPVVATSSPQKRRRAESSDSGTPAKQAAVMQQRRKESHNATEQKRRQRINDKMAELKDILPADKDSMGDKSAPDKATILSDAIDFIRKLHTELREVVEKRAELERVNLQLCEENQRLKKQVA